MATARNWCPGGGDWAIDPKRRDGNGYRCYGCLRSLRIPKSGHRVGLVPVHKRTPEQWAAAKNAMETDFRPANPRTT